MQSGIHHTTFAVNRLSSVFKNSGSRGFSFLGTMIDRSMNSKPVCNSVKSLKNGGDERPMQKGAMGKYSNGREKMVQSVMPNNDAVQSRSFGTSKVTFEEEFPSLSASISSNSKSKSKRRTRVDLENWDEKKLEKEAGHTSSLQLQAPDSTSHHNNASLPTSFGKMSLPSVSKSPKHKAPMFSHENSGDETFDICLYKTPKHKAPKSPMFSHENSGDETFDICLYKTPKHKAPKSFVNKKNRVWVQKGQSTKDNGKMNHKTISLEELGQVLRPGMVLFKHYIPISEQVNIVNRCRELGLGPGGFYRPGYKDGGKLRLFMMCLGLDWNPQTKTYGDIRQHDNVQPPIIPCEFTSLVSKILDDSHTLIKKDLKMIDADNLLPQMSPDVCIVNFYTTNGRLGLHQDRDESVESLQKGYPVVSISVGDSAEFLYGDLRDVDKAESVLLESGDVLIFGGESRHIFHGVTNIIPKTAPSNLLEIAKLRPGRLNLTFRKY